MLRVWNVTLVIVTFLLTIFGTFMTRSGIVQSVHAFGEDRELAWMFTAFMAAILAVSFGWVIYRLPLLRSRHELDSWLSREAAFLANNWILLFCALFVLFATMFPTLSEAVTGERLTVGPPFFNKWMAPIGLVLLFLTGTAPLLAWRKSTVQNLREQFLWPVVAAFAVAGALVALGVRVWSSGLCFALCAYVSTTILQEFWRGARVRQAGTGTDVFTALVGLVGRNKRRYGGYIVHVGIVLIFFGFAGDGFKREEQVLLKPGQEATVGHYSVRHDSIQVTDDGQKQMVTAHLTVFEDGAEIGKMYPAKWFFRKREAEPTTEVAIRRQIAEDLYIVLPAFDLKDQSASLHIVVNPLVNWIWVGFGIMAIGTGIALLPERAYSFAIAAGAGGRGHFHRVAAPHRFPDPAVGGAALCAARRQRARLAHHTIAERARDCRQARMLVRGVPAAPGRHVSLRPLRPCEGPDRDARRRRRVGRAGATALRKRAGRHPCPQPAARPRLQPAGVDGSVRRRHRQLRGDWPGGAPLVAQAVGRRRDAGGHA